MPFSNVAPGSRFASLAACLFCAAILHPLPAIAAVPAQAETAAVPISLDAALTLADEANIDVIRARLALKTAQANLRMADTAPNPVFSVNSTQIRPSQIGVVPYDRLADTVARVDLPLERGASGARERRRPTR